jgi:hypothetical protein
VIGSGGWRSWVPALGAGVVAAMLYGATLMVVVSGCSSEYCADVGEFQVALATWGTVHYTGYPLYMLLGSPFVAALRQIGVPASAGASAFSLVWEAAAVAGAALLIQKLTQAPVLAFAGGLLVAVFEPMWVHGSLAEVYSLSLLLTVALLGLTIRLREHWSDAGGWLLAFLAGLGAAHHRLIAILLPAVGLYLLSTAWRSPKFWRWLLVALVCFAAGFAPYLDLPWRVWRGSTWNYGQPQTWDGFWFIFWGSETGSQRVPILSVVELARSALIVLRELARLATWPGLLAGIAVAAYLLWRRPIRPAVVLLLGGLASYLAFAVVFRRAVLLAADLMPVLLILALLTVLGVCALPRMPRLAGTIGLLAWAAWLTFTNWPVVTGLTRDLRGAALVEQAAQLPAPRGSVIMQPWGPDYFPLAYAKRVDGKYPSWTIVDHRADLAGLASETGGVYTSAATPYEFGLEWWASKLGSPLQITSAAPGWIELTAKPLPPPIEALQPIGGGIALENCRVAYRSQGQQLVVTVNWVATQTVQKEYSTYAYVSDKDAITEPGDLVAQSDFAAPVYGWYPTTQWEPGEVVREDHTLDLPADRAARSIFVGMYSRNEAGGFEQLGRLRLVTSQAGDCAAEPADVGN